jgi:PKD repeat protein
LADFIFDVDSISKTVQFSDKSVGDIDKWYWDFGDGTTSDLKNPVKIYGNAGYYNVKFSAKNQSTGCSHAIAKLINVSDLAALRASFSYGLDSVRLKAGSYPVTFVGCTTGDASKYVWSFGDGTKDSTTISPTHIYSQAGIYNVCLAVSDPVIGQSNTYCGQVNVGAVGVESLAKDIKGLKVYPTPFKNLLNITFELPESGDFEIVLVDVKGSLVKSILKGNREKGTYSENWIGTAVINGVYYLQLLYKGQIISMTEVVKVE